MIELTRLNGHKLAINCDLIRFAESSPDTVLTMVTGEKLLVRESLAELSQHVLRYRAATLREAWPTAAAAFSACAANDVAASLNPILNQH